MLVCDQLCITHSFFNIAINNVSLNRFFGLHFYRRECRRIFNHFYLVRLKATEFGKITHGSGPFAVITAFKVI